MFDGSRIRVPVVEKGSVSQQTRMTFAHELTHACLASMGDWPAWLHEGLAQKMSGETLHPSQRSMVVAALRQGRLPKLTNMGQTFARLSAAHAHLAYAYSAVAVDVMLERWKDYGLQNILRMPDRFGQITDELDKLLASK